MDKDKAIQLLKRLQDPEPYEPMLTKDAYDAIQMAIDALSADGDTISRQAAISAICNDCGKIDCDKMDKCEKLQLPPTNCSEFPNNSDTISRQAAIDAMAELQGRASTKAELKGISKAWKRIKQLPPIQPEIVRCKDCKYAEYIDDVQTLWCTECGQGRTVAPNDFCSYAERRDDEH